MPPRANSSTLQLLFKFVILSGASRKTESDIFVYFYNQFCCAGRVRTILHRICIYFGPFYNCNSIPILQYIPTLISCEWSQLSKGSYFCWNWTQAPPSLKTQHINSNRHKTVQKNLFIF